MSNAVGLVPFHCYGILRYVYVGWLIRVLKEPVSNHQICTKNPDSCLVVLVDLFAQTDRASNYFKKYLGL